LIKSESMFNIKKSGGFRPYIRLLFYLNCEDIIKCNNGSPQFQ